MIFKQTSPKMAIALATLLVIGSVPAMSWAKKAESPATVDAASAQSANQSTYNYVQGVFDKLQANWEKQSYEDRLDADSTLTFVIGADGKIRASRLNAAAGDNGAGKKALDALTASAPFAPLPHDLAGNNLEFKFRLAQGSLRIISYDPIPNLKNQDSLITYSSPSSPASAGTSLFYARVVDSSDIPKTGRVLETPQPAVASTNEATMNTYVEGVQQKIQENWQQPGDSLSFAPTVAIIQIDRDGSVLSTTVKQSSGNKTVDAAIVKTIANAAPFNRVPDAASSLPMTIEYVFEPAVTTQFVEEGK